MTAKPPASLVKHQMVFLLTYLVLAGVSLVLTSLFAEQASVVGLAIVPFAAWTALRSFTGDENRGMREGEKRRMLGNGVMQVLVFRVVADLLSHGMADMSFVLISSVLGTAIAAVLLSFMYWSWDVRPAGAAQTRRHPTR